MSRLFTMNPPGPITSHFLFNTIITEPTSAYMLCLHHLQSNTRQEYLQVYPQLYTAFTKMILSSSPSAPCALASNQEKRFNSEACLTAARVVAYLLLYPPTQDNVRFCAASSYAAICSPMPISCAWLRCRVVRVKHLTQRWLPITTCFQETLKYLQRSITQCFKPRARAGVSEERERGRPVAVRCLSIVLRFHAVGASDAVCPPPHSLGTRLRLIRKRR